MFPQMFLYFPISNNIGADTKPAFWEAKNVTWGIQEHFLGLDFCFKNIVSFAQLRQGHSKRVVQEGLHPPMSCSLEIVNTVEVLSAKFYFWRITLETIKRFVLG